MSEANKIQVGGAHWLGNKIQCWDYIAANGIGYFEGNVIKYVTSCRGAATILYLAKVLDGTVDESLGSWVVLPVALRPVGKLNQGRAT